MNEIVLKARKLLEKNRRSNNGGNYTVPSHFIYPYQWFWDSCFAANVWANFDVEWAEKEILSLVSKQLPGGKIPHMIYWKKPLFRLKIDWGLPGTSSLLQPPIIADTVEHIMAKGGSEKFLKSVYPHLIEYYKYILRERFVEGLAAVVNSDETGEDDAPRFDEAYDIKKFSWLGHRRLRRKLAANYRDYGFDDEKFLAEVFSMRDLPFNCHLVVNMNAMAKLAKMMGTDGSGWARTADKISDRIAKLEVNGTWRSVNNLTGNPSKYLGYETFMPLYSKSLPKNKAKLLVESHLMNKNEFWGKYPVPTVAVNEPIYRKNGYWRGPVWMNTNWFIWRGLNNYGFEEQAASIMASSLALVNKSGFREYFNADNGKGLGAWGFTWSTIVLEMMGDN